MTKYLKETDQECEQTGCETENEEIKENSEPIFFLYVEAISSD